MFFLSSFLSSNYQVKEFKDNIHPNHRSKVHQQQNEGLDWSYVCSSWYSSYFFSSNNYNDFFLQIKKNSYPLDFLCYKSNNFMLMIGWREKSLDTK